VNFSCNILLIVLQNSKVANENTFERKEHNGIETKSALSKISRGWKPKIKKLVDSINAKYSSIIIITSKLNFSLVYHLG